MTSESFQFSGKPSSSSDQNAQNTPVRNLIGEESHLQTQFSTTDQQIQNLPSVTQSQTFSSTVSQNSEGLSVSSSQNSADDFVASFPNSVDNFVSSTQNSADTFKSSVPFTTLSPPTSSFNPHPVTTIAPNIAFPQNQVISTFQQDFTHIDNEVGSPGISVTSETDENVVFNPVITESDGTLFEPSDSIQQSASELTLSGDESKLHSVSDTFITSPFDLSPLRQNPTDGNYILSLRRVMDDGTEQPLDIVISVDGRLMGAVNPPAQAPSPITLQNLSNDQSLNLGLLFNELDQQTDVLRDKRHMNHMNDRNSTVSLSTVLQNLTKSLGNTTVLKNGENIKVRPYVTTHNVNGTRLNRTPSLSTKQMAGDSLSSAPKSENGSTSFLSPSTVSPSVLHSSESPAGSLQSLANLLDKNVYLMPSNTAIGNPLPFSQSGINRPRPFSVNLSRKRAQYSLIPNLHIQNRSFALENITLSVPEILRMMRTGQIRSRNTEEESQQSYNWHPALLSTHLYATQPQVIQNYYIQVPEGNQGLGREAEEEHWRPEMRPLNQRARELLEEDNSVQTRVNETEKSSNFTEEMQRYTPHSGSRERTDDLADGKDGPDLHMKPNRPPSLMTSSPLLQHLSSFVPSFAEVPMISSSVKLPSSSTSLSTPSISNIGQHLSGNKDPDIFRLLTSAPNVTNSSEESDLEVSDVAPLTTSRTTRDTTFSTPDYAADQVLTLNPVKLNDFASDISRLEPSDNDIEKQVAPLNKTVGPQSASRAKNNNSSLKNITSSLMLHLHNNSSEFEGINSKNLMDKKESGKIVDAILRPRVTSTPLSEGNQKKDQIISITDMNDQASSSPTVDENLEPVSPSVQGKDFIQSEGRR